MKKYYQISLLVLSVTVFSGCASHKHNTANNPTTEAYSGYVSTSDPFEGFNRKMTTFNLAADRYVLKPVTEAYTDYIPTPVQGGLRNFLSNLRDPFNSVYNLLQLKPIEAGQDLGRFLINTTVGIAGFADPATEMGIPKHKEDLGQTLAVWGVPAGPYVVLPFLGPSNVRDAASGITQRVYANPESLVFNAPTDTILSGIGFINTRQQLLGLDELLDAQPDKYTFLRDAYRDNRYLAIMDLKEKPQSLRDAEDDEIFDALGE